ncbi:MAG: hypothetical protein HKN39_05245 [Flavobacteriales bacterium]|nr:hypothetical protein [Flavobacteriales bacterium]
MKVLRWIVDSHIWIALGSSSLAIFSFKSVYANIDSLVICFLFSSTLFIYNLQTLIKRGSKKTTSANRSSVKLSELKALTAISLLSLIPLGFSLNMDKVLFLGIFVLISLLYAAKLKWTKRNKTDLRSIPFIKIYLIAIVWVGVSVAFPLYYIGHPFSMSEYLFLLTFFFYFIGITIPFDIRDIKFDAEKMKTIPQNIGVGYSKGLSMILLLAAGIIAFFLYTQAFLDRSLMLLAMMIFLLSIILSYNSDHKKSNHFFTGLIDGTIVLFALAYFF